MDIFTPTPGVIYKFTFVDGYTYFNGAYKVVKIMSYDEYVSNDRGDIISDFYTPAFTDRLASSEESVDLVEINNTFLNDQEEVRRHKILKLTTPEEVLEESDNGIYVSMYYIKDVPDFNIRKYQKFGLVTYLGVADEQTTLDTMREMLKTHADSALGIDSDPTFVSVGEEWLTDNEYQEILEERKAKIEKTINYFTETVRLNQIINGLKDEIAAYEKLIQQLNKDLHNSAQIISEQNASIETYLNTIHQLETRVQELEEIING